MGVGVLKLPAKLCAAVLLLAIFLPRHSLSANITLLPSSGDENSSETFSDCHGSSRKVNPGKKHPEFECRSSQVVEYHGNRETPLRSLRSTWYPGPPPPIRNQIKTFGYVSPPSGPMH
ncbi:PREDICTED: uncharacterized protein LOC104593112 [Nelumbo nucifera]|uniref:Uncharacterized protein LOC104593112 n=2 Tax=Nelumbo nucifera TaxID=4432 RepID=A0A1U7ZS82_NELNU|nr:PREDICTED: uncharacterized protein LOC104593112 [Nelumbo nucifera]DAD34482.1 TPA_asm: hypothetical protein HUJ06_005122 [Nelumbo nucifera]